MVNVPTTFHMFNSMLVYHLYVIMRETRLLTLRNKAHYTRSLKAVFNHSVWWIIQNSMTFDPVIIFYNCHHSNPVLYLRTFHSSPREEQYDIFFWVKTETKGQSSPYAPDCIIRPKIYINDLGLRLIFSWSWLGLGIEFDFKAPTELPRYHWVLKNDVLFETTFQ